MCRRGENIYKRKDGRFEGRYVIGKKVNGTTRFGYVFGYQYTEVRSRLAQRRAEMAEATKLPAYSKQRIGFIEWANRWLYEEMIGSVKESTFQTYESVMRNHLTPRFGKLTLDEIDQKNVRCFIAGLEDAGFAESTIRGAFRLLNTLFKAAQEEGIVSRNPCYRIKIQRREAKEQKILTAAQQEKLRSEASPDNFPVLLSLYTGMRLGEICALKWKDIGWEERTITIRRTAQRLKHSGATKTRIVIGAPKTSRSCRPIPIPAFILEMLLALRKDARSDDFIFGKPGSAADPRSVQRRFQRLANKLGFEDIHFHTLRHTFASRLIEMRVDIKTVSDLLGHSSTKTTLEVYAHSLLENRRIAIDRLAMN